MCSLVKSQVSSIISWSHYNKVGESTLTKLILVSRRNFYFIPPCWKFAQAINIIKCNVPRWRNSPTLRLWLLSPQPSSYKNLRRLVILLTPKAWTAFFENIEFLGSSLWMEFFVLFSLKILHNMYPRSSFKTQQFSELLTIWLKSYCMIYYFHCLAGGTGSKKNFFKNHF